MRIVKAREMGVCFGIRRAFTLAKEVYSESRGRKLYVYGDLAHNKYVIRSLSEGGFFTIYKAEDAEENSVVLIRAHGISDKERSVLIKKNVEIVDATCPLVLKNQDYMRTSEYDVILIGTKGHSETVSVEGAACRTYYIVQDPCDLDAVPNDRTYRIIVQTTFESSRLEMVKEAIMKRGYSFVLSNSICNSSVNRRASIREMKGVVPFLFVIGDVKSANSNALVSEARNIGIDAVLIEDENDIDPSLIKDFDCVGVSAGSSTPDFIIDRVVRRLESI